MCGGVCSVFVSRRPVAKSRKKSIPSSGALLGLSEVVSCPGGHCSGSHVVFCSVSLCNAFEAAWAFGRNSSVLKVPPFVIRVIVAHFRDPSLANCGMARRISPNVLKL